MDVQDVFDRAEITELLARYCHAIDQHDWAALRALFTGDARLDYSALGGPLGDADAVIGFVRPIVEALANTQHMVSTVTIAFRGEEAVVRSAAQVAMTSGLPDGARQTVVIGLWYEDVARRTPEGWRIAARRQVPGWSATLPLALAGGATDPA